MSLRALRTLFADPLDALATLPPDYPRVELTDELDPDNLTCWYRSDGHIRSICNIGNIRRLIRLSRAMEDLLKNLGLVEGSSPAPDWTVTLTGAELAKFAERVRRDTLAEVKRDLVTIPIPAWPSEMHEIVDRMMQQKGIIPP